MAPSAFRVGLIPAVLFADSALPFGFLVTPAFLMGILAFFCAFEIFLKFELSRKLIEANPLRLVVA